MVRPGERGILWKYFNILVTGMALGYSPAESPVSLSVSHIHLHTYTCRSLTPRGICIRNREGEQNVIEPRCLWLGTVKCFIYLTETSPQPLGEF